MRNIKVIRNGQIVLKNGILWDGVVIIQDERIVAVGNKRDLDIPTGAQIIDAKGAYVGPGFIDIHVHGGGGYSTCYDLKNAAEFFLNHGSTSILATPDYHMNRETILEVLKNIKADIDELKSVKGIYMEGPYTNPIYGSHSDTNPWRCGVSPEDFIPIVDEAGSYGEQKRIDVPSRLLSGIAKAGKFTLTFRTTGGGLALYGRNSGRYPHGLLVEVK